MANPAPAVVPLVRGFGTVLFPRKAIGSRTISGLPNRPNRKRSDGCALNRSGFAGIQKMLNPVAGLDQGIVGR